MLGSITCDNQIIDMSDWDFSEVATTKESMDVVRNRRARAIIMSTAMGITKFRSQSKREDPHRLMRGPISQVKKAIKCAREQDRRGLYFVLEAIIGEEDERSRAVQELVNQDGIFVSKEYSIMYREGEFGWVVARAKIVTNSVAVRDNIDKAIAGRHWMKTLDNNWMVDAVAKGVNQEKEMTIMGLDVDHVFGQDNEAFMAEEQEVRKHWDDLGGKELDPNLVKQRQGLRK